MWSVGVFLTMTCAVESFVPALQFCSTAALQHGMVACAELQSCIFDIVAGGAGLTVSSNCRISPTRAPGIPTWIVSLTRSHAELGRNGIRHYREVHCTVQYIRERYDKSTDAM